jgi:DNA-binding NarL/FixJ family response regulator
VPFFVEELAAALAGAVRVQANQAGELELIGSEAEMPIPSSVRDAFLLRADSLSDDARSALDIAAVAGVTFDLALVNAASPGEVGSSTMSPRSSGSWSVGSPPGELAVRLVAVGRTNQEIGRHLLLSTCTIDMHVRNVLAKLGARSRAEATHRAGQLRLLAPA